MTDTLTRYEVVDDGLDEAQWLRKRKNYIGASQSAAILGLSPYMTPLDVWKSMQPDAVPIEESRHMLWGKRLESVVADWAQVDYADTLGQLAPSPGLLASVDYPFIAATPDRENIIDGRPSAFTEIKTGSEYTKSSWFEEFTGEPSAPLQYQVQLSQQLWVRGYEYGFIQALIGGNHLLEPRRLQLDLAFVDIMLDEISGWYVKYIVGETPPPATRFDDLRALYKGSPAGVPSRIDATPDIMRKVRKRNRLQPRLAQGKKYDDELKGDIMAFMADFTELVDPETGQIVVTWYQGRPPAPKFDPAQFALDHPDLYKQYLVSKEAGRTMLFKKGQ